MIMGILGIVKLSKISIDDDTNSSLLETLIMYLAFTTIGLMSMNILKMTLLNTLRNLLK